MRALTAVSLALMLALAGCNVGFQSGDSPTPTATPTTDAPTDATAAPDGGDGGSGTDASQSGFDFADPDSDRLGWEDGYWYNESTPVNATDGLNATELNATVARAMARVEHVRQLEFEETVPVTVVNRSVYREQFSSGQREHTEAFRTFDNTKFEALFLIGEDTDSLGVQNSNRGSNVLGFYSPKNDTIVIVSESPTPKLKDELTLGHELVHALQDQRYNLSSYVRPTREIYNAYNGVIEGDANYVQFQYQDACEADWECISVPSEGSGGGSSDLHFGVYFLNYFPYSDGPGFVGYHHARGGWEAVNALYEEMPASSEQVIYPEKYGEDAPADVSLADTQTNGWERVRPESPRPGQVRPDYATFGQSGIAAMFAYTFSDDVNRSQVIDPREFINYENGGQVNRTDPLNYDVAYASGWDGDRLHIYTSPDAGENETAYVWKTVWDSPAEAEEFATGYRKLLSHWGGDRVEGSANHWVIDRGPFPDAFYLEVEGDTVTVVNAPTRGDLGDVYADYRPPANASASGSA